MECNSLNSEEVHAKQTAGEKIQSKDYIGARIIIQKALKNFPNLEYANEMLTVCEILCSSEIQLPGCGLDCYLILQLFPSVENVVIKEQYHKLVSLLKPIKEDFPGTDMALEFIDNAYTVLSDPVKRAAFEAKRIETYYNTLPCSSWAKKAAHVASTDTVPLMKGIADEKPKKRICFQESNGIADHMSSAEKCSNSQQIATQKGADFVCYNFTNIRKPELFSVGQVWVVYDIENQPRHYAWIDSIHPHKFLMQVRLFKPRPESLFEKKWCTAGLPVACGQYSIDAIKTTLNGHMFSHLLSNYILKQPLEVYPRKCEVWAIYRDWNTEWCSKPGLRKSSSFEIVEILTDYMKDIGVSVVHLVKVDGFRNVFQRSLNRGKEQTLQIPAGKMTMFSHSVPAFRFVGGVITGITRGMLELDPLAVPDNLVALADTTAHQTSEEIKYADGTSANPSTYTNVFIENQKPKWSAKDFTAGQVWAVYDGPDAMPRAFVQVHYAVSTDKVCVTFLECHPVTDEEIDWVENSLPIVCGIFYAGKRMVNLGMSRFSHIVDCHKSSINSLYRIFPRKGEIWAMYEHWNSRWKKSNLVDCQCRIVEILSNYSEETGLSVCSLIEVPGCITLFHRQLHDGFLLTMHLSKFEMLGFSHQIPAFTVQLTRDHCIPQGSWHLDPAALPPKRIN
ncbi:hypothetical protein J5N97_016562 [Dioscorea zingiberensis]|uniref:J domain-containing protein n=1 Tax=Dioscorea zingiberensis TaxID=325984 RepID=A0A9D5HFS6_9LILI|nr:hypothetical protein J5N97_016562 [Dioscorea zingiberensis]